VADGIVGPDTWNRLVEAGFALGDRTLYLRRPFFRGDDVLALQRRLNALGFDAWKEDGIFGTHVDRAVREFQRNVGQEPDGIVGPDTLEALERLRPDVDAPGRSEVREAESFRTPGGLSGALIAIDPGHGPGGPGDPGATGLGGQEEHDAAFRIARALAANLDRRGARTLLLRGPGDNPTVEARARRANEAGAVLLVSIHTNDGPAEAGGCTTLYYGTERTESPAGRRLAELIQEEMCRRIGLADCRTHRMALPILRETSMPAVQVEPCFITNPDEERLLADPGFVSNVAGAIAEAIGRFLGSGTSGQTGRPRRAALKTIAMVLFLLLLLGGAGGGLLLAGRQPNGVPPASPVRVRGAVVLPSTCIDDIRVVVRTDTGATASAEPETSEAAATCTYTFDVRAPGARSYRLMLETGRVGGIGNTTVLPGPGYSHAELAGGGALDLNGDDFGMDQEKGESFALMARGIEAARRVYRRTGSYDGLTPARLHVPFGIAVNRTPHAAPGAITLRQASGTRVLFTTASEDGRSFCLGSQEAPDPLVAYGDIDAKTWGECARWQPGSPTQDQTEVF
jgi:N-acetylmuramoyl-L-alanine amidase